MLKSMKKRKIALFSGVGASVGARGGGWGLGGGNGDHCVRAEHGAIFCTHSVYWVCLTYFYILRSNKGDINPQLLKFLS